MKKLIMIMVLALTTINCGYWNKFKAAIKGSAKECVDGVTYLQFVSGAQVQVDSNGKPVPCE
jgi:hypothetical protein